KTSYISPQWERLYRSQVLNFDDLYSRSRINSGWVISRPVYLLIYANAFRPEVCPALDTFIEWKRKKGFIVDACNLDWIIPPVYQGNPSNAEELKAGIQSWYEGILGCYNRRPYCILFVGDSPVFDKTKGINDFERYIPVKCADDSHIPTWYFDGHDEFGNGKYSDYFYQLLVGSDDFADIPIGRWCVRNQADLEAYVRKTLDYERDIEPEPHWNLDKAMLCAAYDFRNPPEEIIPIDGKHLVWEGVLQPIGFEVDSVYGQLGDHTTKMVNILETEPGVGILNYIGHGYFNFWSRIGNMGDNFFTYDIRSLENEVRCPLVYGIACFSGNICWTNDGTNEVETMVEAWTRYPDGGGTAAFGASYSIGRAPSHTVDSAIFSGHFDHELNCGMAIIYGKTCGINAWHTGTYDGLDLARVTYWIGDPDLDVWRGSPFLAYDSVSFGTEIEVWVKAISTHIPLPGTKVCIYHEDGQYHQISYTDKCGKAWFPYPSSVDIGMYYVTATNQSPDYSIVPACTSFEYNGSPPGQQDEPLVDMFEWKLEPVQPSIMCSNATVSYSVGGIPGSKESEFVEMAIFDASGRRIKTLVSRKESPGHHAVTWDGENTKGASCSAGVYFIRMSTDKFSTNERIILLR
ncbi:hypothetical protein JXM67_07395, partial [candidate division WOR-3 bacterium]|nr:hypothetical protein [candidate division WOR-3 bacterium]